MNQRLSRVAVPAQENNQGATKALKERTSLFMFMMPRL